MPQFLINELQSQPQLAAAKSAYLFVHNRFVLDEYINDTFDNPYRAGIIAATKAELDDANGEIAVGTSFVFEDLENITADGYVVNIRESFARSLNQYINYLKGSDFLYQGHFRIMPVFISADNTIVDAWVFGVPSLKVLKNYLINETSEFNQSAYKILTEK